MRHVFRFLVLVLPTASAFAQSFEDSISAYGGEVAAAKASVVEKYQEAILAEVKAGHLGAAEQIRQFSQRFDTKGVLTEVKDHPMAGTFRAYGKALKAAGDKLREAYVKELERLTRLGEIEAANSLVSELNARRLPADLVSFQTQRGNAYLNHWGLKFQANQPKSVGGRMNATFELTAGLSKPQFVSFRSINWPDYYLDHFGYRIRLTPVQDDLSWKQHASWIKLPGLTGRRGVSFRSVSHPDRYIRIRRNGEAWLDKFENNLEYKQQATFYQRKPLFGLW
jgi:Alpha-L-arabinofuranosidase B (ABFB) domain